MPQLDEQEQQLFQKVMENWLSLSAEEKPRRLPDFVEQVTFNPQSSKIRIAFNQPGMAQLVDWVDQPRSVRDAIRKGVTHGPAPI